MGRAEATGLLPISGSVVNSRTGCGTQFDIETTRPSRRSTSRTGILELADLGGSRPLKRGSEMILDEFGLLH